MHRVGIRLSALLLLAFVAIHAQCLAYCALGLCPLTVASTAHPHCPHHPANGKMPAPGAAHHCTSQEAFLVEGSPKTAGLHAVGAAIASSDAFPVPAAAPLQPEVDASPPITAPPPSPFVLRI
jgi:hypothetical protein